MDGALPKRGDQELGGAPEGLDALTVAERLKADGGVGVFVARDYARMGEFVQAFGFFADGVDVVEFPAWDCLPYDRLSPTSSVSAERMAALTRLAQRAPGDRTPLLLVTTVSAAMQRTPPREVTSGAGFGTTVGLDLDTAALERYFAANGYMRASTVSEKGEFAVRGGVIDVYPPGFDEPVRLDMFGSELESIRTFDPDTQRSTGQRREVHLAPVSEALLDADSISRFRTGYLGLFGAAGDDPLYAAISEGARRQGMEHWLPLLYDRLETLFDYLPDDARLFMDNQVEAARAERWTLTKDAWEARRDAAMGKGGAAYRALPPERLYLPEADWNSALAGRWVRRLSPLQGPGEDAGGRLGRSFSAERAQDSVNLFEAVARHAQALKTAGKRVLFASWSEGSSERLAAMLADHGLEHVVAVRNWADVQSAPKDIYLRGVLPVEHGFETDTIAVISETDMLGDRLARPRKKRRASNFLAEASALTTGDLVVHLDHGIGRYEGLKTLEIQEAPHDCLELLYAGDSKLYLPVENIDLLTRYGSETDGAQLDRLGGAAWQGRKAKAKARLRDMAEGLIALAAKRSLRTSAAITPPHGLFDEFCARFPYEETDDQLNAIGDVLEDLGKGTPMDRLICGDVGFGKTEVALRAAFVVAMTGQQVAIVCPTTLLARQHFKTFSERFAGWPVTVRHLSRMVTAKDAAETRAGLKTGAYEIVVGTHAVLSEQVGFKDLGLVIVDEEQHFGVKHKEKLKGLRADVHLLTLTATPIPRTLQMALSGIREMSIIATPPVDRLAVRTYVTPWDPVLVREALLREKYRGGQAYYVVPRLSDLPDIEQFLREKVPEIKFVVGHGQMSPTQLEDVMSAFYDGSYDLLLSTTIVESGLDVPTANTLIVHKADMFGLAQLHQIRGRIGRAKARAFAYLTTPPNKPMSLSSERRLQVLQSLDNLGAGFQLASHDLDQRGGGNLLGDEQSGHIREVGVELYQQMLEDAVSELRLSGEGGGVVDRGWSPAINVGAAVLIPENYVPDLNVRLSLYRRLSDAENSETREALAAELIDRFGPLPDEAKQLLRIVGIKANCKTACIERIDIGPKGAVLTLRNNAFPNPMGLVGLIQKNHAFWKIRPDQKIVVKGEWDTAAERLKVAERITADLARVAGA
ncbi:MAG: transcription-repair coupling factor [Alphaproteobacteria bacterium]|jgi:transcription-repair coupling factor (superfamily II helicase)|nr:transcription-repair coupling factor [Alphaproteobacteria bacterium]MBU2124673.1 transcription-repair coupling factor [Alphaproteobacteria bacterium]MBU2207492.1 transcription-repair coupling factor [Alphaproteobacteria bacterium]